MNFLYLELLHPAACPYIAFVMPLVQVFLLQQCEILLLYQCSAVDRFAICDVRKDVFAVAMIRCNVIRPRLSSGTRVGEHHFVFWAEFSFLLRSLYSTI